MFANVSNTATPLAVFSSQSSLGTWVPSHEIASIDEHPNCAKRRLLSAAEHDAPVVNGCATSVRPN
jgi:hypothetical protein